MAEKKKAIKEVKRVVKPLTDDEKILGIVPKTKIEKVFDYESEDVRYKITNLLYPECTPTIVTGAVIETFIGNRNKEARKLIKQGVKEVTTMEHYTNKPMYKIEVLD